MCGFVLWTREKLGKFHSVSPESFIGQQLRDQSAFTAFLEGLI